MEIMIKKKNNYIVTEVNAIEDRRAELIKNTSSDKGNLYYLEKNERDKSSL